MRPKRGCDTLMVYGSSRTLCEEQREALRGRGHGRSEGRRGGEWRKSLERMLVEVQESGSLNVLA